MFSKAGSNFKHPTYLGFMSQIHNFPNTIFLSSYYQDYLEAKLFSLWLLSRYTIAFSSHKEGVLNSPLDDRKF